MTPREELIVSLIPKLLHDERNSPRWLYEPMPVPDDVKIVERAGRMADQILREVSLPMLEALCASRVACEAATAWAAEREIAGRDFSDPHRDALNRLEAATSTSDLRKVRP